MKKVKSQKKPLIILTAGGTGGHVYPAEALAEELEKRGYRLALITDSRGKDNYKGKLGQIKNYAVWSGGIVGKSKWFKIKSLFKTGIGVLQAGWILLRERPVCVVGFGGYASFPASMAALLSGIDLVIHEQNSVMSRTNRFLSKYASLIAQSFKKVKYTPLGAKTVLTGMPVREAITALYGRAYPKLKDGEKIKILVLGGSQGAKVFGEVLPSAIKNLDKDLQKRISLHQQCRRGEENTVRESFRGSVCDVEVKSFFDNMAEMYAQIHLIISRAGASSVSEIAVAGVPSILVPLPTAADDHQTLNAKEIADVQAGLVFMQTEFTSEKVEKVLEDLIKHPDKLEKMAKNTSKVAIVDAAKRFADALEHHIINSNQTEG